MCKDQHSDFSDAHPTGPSVPQWKPRGWDEGREKPLSICQVGQQAQPQICVCHTFHSPVFAVLCAGSSGWSVVPEAQPWAAQLALALSDQGELLAPPPTATALPLNPRHEQNNIHIVFIKDFPANTVQKRQSSPLHLVPGDNLSPGQQDCTELYFCSLAESTYWKRREEKYSLPSPSSVMLISHVFGGRTCLKNLHMEYQHKQFYSTAPVHKLLLLSEEKAFLKEHCILKGSSRSPSLHCIYCHIVSCYLMKQLSIYLRYDMLKGFEKNSILWGRKG